MTIKLAAPRIRVALEQPATDELLEIDLQTDNRDLVMWDATRNRRGWPKGQDAPMLWLTFLAWHALKRSGEAAEDFDSFNDRCVAIVPVDAEGTEIDPRAAGVAGESDPVFDDAAGLSSVAPDTG